MGSRRATSNEFLNNHRRQVWETVYKLLANEHWEEALGDVALAEAVKAQGLWTTDFQIRDLRIEHGIGSSEERKIIGFAKDFEKGRAVAKKGKK